MEGARRHSDERGRTPLDWLILGGGIHGVHVAVRLIDDGGVAPERLSVVDPGPRLLDRWRTCAETTGMTHLRSPSMHHIDTPSMSLERFADARSDRPADLFTAPNDRPSLELFNSHCDHVIERLGLAERHVRDRAVSIDVSEDAVGVELASGDVLRSRRLVLALGSGDRLAWPAWAPGGDPRVRHVFGDEPVEPSRQGSTVGVVGGGLTAGQVALRLVRSGHRVELISRHSPRTQQYDAEPGWFGPKYMRSYERVRDLEVRRSMIADGRHRGSMTPEVRRELDVVARSERLTEHRSGVRALDDHEGRLRLTLGDGSRVDVDELRLATGVTNERPGGAMLDRLIEEASLPCAPCGYPIVDSALRWHPRITVTGPLAELEIGPIARNIAGARRAGDRVLLAS